MNCAMSESVIVVSNSLLILIAMTCLFIHGALYMINQISFTILKLNLSGPFQTLGMDGCIYGFVWDVSGHIFRDKKCEYTLKWRIIHCKTLNFHTALKHRS